MTLGKYYLNSVMYPSIVSIIGGAAFAAYDERNYVEQ